MTQINLLPWREHIRQERYVRYIVNLVFHLLLVVAVAVIINASLYIRIQQQKSRNSYLETQLGFENRRLIELNQAVDEFERIKKELQQLISLKRTSYQAVRQLDALARVVPSNIILNKIVRNGLQITLTGDAESNQQVTMLMKNIADSNVFKKSDLTQINIADTGSSENKRFVINLLTKPMVPK